MSIVATKTIEAQSFWTDVCRVEQGATYSLSAHGIWIDWFRRCGPEGYQYFPFKPFESSRRAPGAPWFCLIGALDRNEAAAFAIGTDRSWTAPGSGQLSCFANDLRWMYWNNRGAVELTVKRRD